MAAKICHLLHPIWWPFRCLQPRHGNSFLYGRKKREERWILNAQPDFYLPLQREETISDILWIILGFIQLHLHSKHPGLFLPGVSSFFIMNCSGTWASWSRRRWNEGRFWCHSGLQLIWKTEARISQLAVMLGKIFFQSFERSFVG